MIGLAIETARPVAIDVGLCRSDSVLPDDTGSMFEALVVSLMADGGVLTQCDSMGEPTIVARCGSLALNDNCLLLAKRSARTVAQAHATRSPGRVRPAVWGDCHVGGVECRAMSIPLVIDNAQQLVLSILYGPGSPTDACHAEDLAHRFGPLIEAAMALWCAHSAQERRSAELRSALDLGGVAVAVLDATGIVRFLNAAMRRMVASGDGLRLHGGALVASDLPSAVRFQCAIQHAVAQAGANSSSPDSPSLALVCKRARGATGLPVAISAVRCPTMERGAPTVVVHAIEPDADLAILVRPICALHGLSPVETSLVTYLINGHTLMDAAKAIRVQPQTARSYLKHIFLKTETNRQTDLVRLMLCSVLRLEVDMVSVPV